VHRINTAKYWLSKVIEIDGDLHYTCVYTRQKLTMLENLTCPKILNFEHDFLNPNSK